MQQSRLVGAITESWNARVAFLPSLLAAGLQSSLAVASYQPFWLSAFSIHIHLLHYVVTNVIQEPATASSLLQEAHLLQIVYN